MRYLSTLAFPPAWLDELRAAVPGVDVVQLPAASAADVPADVWRGVDALHTSSVLPEPGDAPRLRWVQLDTSGVDHVRDTALWRSDVEITTIGGVSPVPLAQYVLFCILGFAHRLPAMLDVRAARHWPTAQVRWDAFLPAALDGATVAIVGYGRIGREIGRLARTHGMSVVGVTRSGRRPDPAGAGQVEFGVAAGGFAVDPTADDADVRVVGPELLADVLATADYLVVVVPLTEHTRGLIGRRTLAALKPGAVVINVARGGVVDESALLHALRSGAVAGAALDVFDEEPLPPTSPWWHEPNVLVTPHVSGLAPRYFEQVRRIVTDNLRRFVDGAPLLNRVDRERGY
ncbi:Phosphoglycerate dehydrogenase [Jatrophihabitans endophyticus]|uniref:Phosphoglycerate dehydrogenase n=1 Tax=Jatrophihabitans endophyticus TaxID=1206085 RepID=A0A1M5CK63_9ACTN|nr:D-2-hydroxyacid dehydrogenase [Jatrophihabitans endophyticus]SHF55091.1 Phosphoglycerate dehydrogenase [Jatrophihabitans endophyticus]